MMLKSIIFIIEEQFTMIDFSPKTMCYFTTQQCLKHFFLRQYTLLLFQYIFLLTNSYIGISTYHNISVINLCSFIQNFQCIRRKKVITVTKYHIFTHCPSVSFSPCPHRSHILKIFKDTNTFF